MQPRIARLSFGFLIALAACGGDSTSPTAPAALSSQDALQSLTTGLSTLVQATASTSSSLPIAMLPPISASQQTLVSQISVTVDDSTVQMFGLAQRIVYPPHSCLEQLIGMVNFADPTSCTAPPGAVLLILWQTSSASQPPNRILVISADTGTANFADQPFVDASFSEGGAFPVGALLWEQNGMVWESSGGSLTSTIMQGDETCTVVLPLFVKAEVCNLGTFTESGDLSFLPIILQRPATGTHTIALSAQAIHGIIQTVTATAPLVIPPN